MERLARVGALRYSGSVEPKSVSAVTLRNVNGDGCVVG
jgi:hypothetical protein